MFQVKRLSILKSETAVIIDDDEIPIRLLINLLTRIPFFDIKIVGTANNFGDGVKLIKTTQPDIVFLDINLPDKNGMEIFNEFQSPHFKIIFCTSHQQFAVEAINNYTSGYLLKPIELFELQETIQKVSKELIEEQKLLQLEDRFNVLNTPEKVGENIMLKVENGFVMANTFSIEYCQTNQSDTIVVTTSNKEILVTKSLKELQEILPQDHFYQTHKLFLININYLSKFVLEKESYVIMESGTKIPVSTRTALVISKDIRLKIEKCQKNIS